MKRQATGTENKGGGGKRERTKAGHKGEVKESGTDVHSSPARLLCFGVVS